MQKLQVLFVEDNPDDVDLLNAQLTQEGFSLDIRRVEIESEYIEALQENPDIVFSDFTMPHFSGLKALEILLKSGKNIPFILISGTIGEEIAVESMRLGATDYLLKDNTLRLATAVRRAIQERDARTKQMRDIEELRISEERFREVVENIREVFWIFDAVQGKISYVSPAYEKIWGRPISAIYAKSDDWLEAIHEEDRQRVRQRNLENRVHGTYNETYRIVRPGGEIRWVHDRAFPIKGNTGEVQRIVGIAEDITEHRSLEDRLRQSQKMEAIGQLAGGIAHDFNNILQVILMEIDLGLKRVPQDGTRQMLLSIKEAAERASNLTRQLLAFGRRQVMQLLHVDINEGLRQLTKMLRRIVGEDIQLKIDLCPESLIAHIDQAMIDQVFVNLIVNARDAMPEGGHITVKTLKRQSSELSNLNDEDASPAQYALIRISDTGNGIPVEVLPHIFEPFFTTKEAGKGTGLGLATAFGIIEQHKGKIHVETNRDGTTFDVLLPLLSSPGKGKNKSKINPHRGSAAILLVEDEHNVRMLNRTVLERNGYRVFEAADGPKALEVFTAAPEKIDILLTDIVMPNGMNGFELAAELQKKKPGLIVLFTTGYSPEFAGKNFPLLPGRNFLQKPYDEEALLNMLALSLKSIRI